MRVLITADLQLGAGNRGRLEDNAQTLNAIDALADELGVSYLLIAGDVFQHRRPAPDELHVFKAWLARLEGRLLGTFILTGNHDHRGPGLPTAAGLFDGLGLDVRVVSSPSVAQLLPYDEGPGIMLGLLPWAHPGHLRAARDGASSSELEDALHRTAADLAVDAGADELVPPSGTDAIPVLLTHYALSGMSTPTGLPTSELREPVLDVQELAGQGWRYVFAGHVHKRERAVLDDGEAWSIGSPWRHDFGEEHLEPAVLVLDTALDDVLAVPTPDRSYITLALDELAGLQGSPRLEGAIVRVRDRLTAEQAAGLDVARIRRELELDGATVAGIHLDVERPVRARAAGIEDSEPLEALNAWASANSVDDREVGRLRELTAELLEVER